MTHNDCFNIMSTFLAAEGKNAASAEENSQLKAELKAANKAKNQLEKQVEGLKGK